MNQTCINSFHTRKSSRLYSTRGSPRSLFKYSPYKSQTLNSKIWTHARWLDKEKLLCLVLIQRSCQHLMTNFTQERGSEKLKTTNKVNNCFFYYFFFSMENILCNRFMTKVDFRRKKYLTISFRQLLNNFSYLVFSYLHVNSDDITFASMAFEKQLYNLIDNSRVWIFFPIQLNVFRTPEFPSIRGQTVRQKCQP